MADELSKLGVNWVDESALRRDIAAEVDVCAGAEAAAEECELQRRWAALEETERVVAGLRASIAAAERGVMTPLTGTPNGRNGEGGSGGGGGARDETIGSAAALKFRLTAAEREAESRATSVRRWQLEMEARQQKRREEARRRDGGTSALPAAVSRTTTTTTAVLTATGGVAPARRETKERGPPGVRVEGSSLRALVSATLSPPAPCKPRYSLRANAIPENATMAVQSGAATPLPRSRENGNSNGDGHDVAPTTLSEYAGGAILPSLYRVTLTRSDVRSKLRKYADDGDLEMFHERQQKRKRLEAVAASMAASQSMSLPSGSVKVEADDGTHVVTVKQEDEKKKSGLTHAEAIDVDALMEESDDAGEDVLRRVLMNAGENNDHSVKLEEKETFVSIAPGMSLPASIYHRLLEHQREGVFWLLQLHAKKAGGILGDEMGLGKTIQVATMLNALYHSRKLHGPCLIVSPLTVLRQWVAEMHRWAPYMRTCVMHESSATAMSREELIASISGTPAVLLTTYTAVRQHCQLLHRAEFQYVIVDEGHKISNPEATVTLAVKSFPTPHRLILSGTPIQNTLKELWCLFDFVKPGLLGTMTKFVSEFEEPINASKNLRASSLVLATAVECARALQERISPYLLRRLKRQVLSHVLPQKYERVIRCPLSDAQLEAYVELLLSPRVQRLLSHTVSHPQIMGGLNRDGRDASGCLHVAGRRFQLMRQQQAQQHGGIRLEAFCVLNELRQICNHVDVFRMRQAAAEDGNYDFEDDVDNEGVDLKTRQQRRRGSRVSLRSNLPVNYEGSGKLLTLKKLMKVWQSGGQRVLIFSQTRMVLDIVENMCEQEGFTYIRMDGSTNGQHRQELMDRFNEDDSIIAALLTTRVGGVGVNLVGANRVVLFDPDWNPVTDEQARERAWRIGQRSDVGVYRLIASGTVEEAILRRQLAKTYVSEKVLHNPELQRFFHQQESLAETFYLGAEYDGRVPRGKKHVLAAQELSPLLEREDDEEEEKETGGQAAVYRVRAMAPAAGDNNNNNENDDDDDDDHDDGGGNSGNCEKSAASRAETALLRDLVDGKAVRVSGADVTARRLARLSASQAMLRVTNTTRTIEHQRSEMRLKLLPNVKEEKGRGED